MTRVLRGVLLLMKWGSPVLVLWASARVSFFQSVEVPLPGGEADIGGEGDPGARDRYEWMRLHDPATGVIPSDMRDRELAFAARLPRREDIDKLAKTGGGAALAWNKRGPFNVGGRTRAFAVDVTDPNVLLAGGVSGGMWRSTDRGISWSKTTTQQQLHSVTCIVQDTRVGKTNLWYIGTGELRGNSAGGGGGASYRGNGIFKSTDGGLSWTVLPSTASNTPASTDNLFDYVWNLAIDPSNAAQDELYAATICGISRSTDGGTTWASVRGSFSNGESRYTDVAVTSSGIVYATMSDLTLGLGSGATTRGLWRSTDGLAWTNITAPGWPAAFSRTVIGIAPSEENIVYYLAETPGSGKQTTYAGATEFHSLWKYRYLSGDGSGAGGLWVNRSASIPAKGEPVGNFASQSSYDLVVKVKPDDSNAVFIGGTNLYRSTNGFADTTLTNWIGGYATSNNITTYFNHHPDQHGLAFAPNNPLVLYSSHDGGISTTSNCLASAPSWSSLNNGYQTTQFYSIAIDHGTMNSNAILGGTQDNGTWEVTSASATAPWAQRWGGDGAYCHINDGRTIFLVSFQNGETYRRLVSGSYVEIDPVGGSGYLFINPFAVDPNNNAVLYLSAGPSLWRNGNLDLISFDNSQTKKTAGWTNLTAAGIPGASITALSVTKTTADRLYYGSSTGKVYRLDNASTATVSTVPTDVWTGKGFPGGAYVSCIAVDPSNGDKALVVFSNYGVQSIFSTTDGGTSWTDVEGNLAGPSGPSVRWGAIVPYGGTTTFFVGTSTGLYSTQSLSGASTVWAQEGASSIGNVVVDMIDYRVSDGFVVVATHGQGVFSGTIVPVSVAEAGVPAFDALYQNYPNPFNPTTTIEFRLARPGWTTLKVYSVNGQEVATLVERELDRGEHRVGWAPSNVASGVYLYTLRSGEFSQSRSLLLLK